MAPMLWTAPEITVQEALERDDLLYVDVRSPEEFARESIPRAVNIPLFDNTERKELGMIYHARGEAEARRAGLQIASARLPRLVAEIAAAAGGKTPLLYCWRGGLRSFSLCQILSLVKAPALRLQGGYRAYRRYVHQALSRYRFGQETVVLRGFTGVGKTELIRRLRERGYAAVDLEELAMHRGSVFGAVGFPRRRSQKDFDALLLQELLRLKGFPYLVLEGEGKRIGDVHLPAFLAEAMEQGVHLHITAPLNDRVRRIVEEYLPPDPGAELLARLREAVLSLQRRLGRERTARLLELLEAENYYGAAEILCTDYYDHLYDDSKPGRYPYLAEVASDDLEQATGEIAGLLDRRYGRTCGLSSGRPDPLPPAVAVPEHASVNGTGQPPDGPVKITEKILKGSGLIR